jgi:hypothetical protein
MEIIIEKDSVSLNKRSEKKQGLPRRKFQAINGEAHEEISSNQWRGL